MFVMTAIGPTEFGDYVFPYWADLLGWIMGASTLVPFFVVLMYRLIKGAVSITFVFFIDIFVGTVCHCLFFFCMCVLCML